MSVLRVAEQWSDTNVGRQRQGNEDSYFVRAPLFVVADGMGGAQAGEVASQMAVDAFQPGLPGPRPEEALVEIIREANRRIHEMSQSDAQRQGMGTTCTAVYVDEDEVVLAHVGDSRCYLLRDGELTRLTRDHSLVGELVDRGKITEEQAEMHPQRSVITRALGPEPDVMVDTERIAARAGDVFLLCSDGLTSMVREAEFLPLLQEAGSLEEAGRKLIAAANAAGGRDNITVVLFRLAETAVAGAAGTQETREVAASAVDDEAGGEPAAAGGAAGATASLTAVRTAPPPPVSQAPPPARPSPPAPRRRRRLVRALVLVAILGAVLVVSGWFATRAVFFVGLDDARAVTIFRGLPYELPAGIELYTRHYTSGVTIEQVPPVRRAAFREHKLRTLEDARDLVQQLELGTLER